MRSLMARALIRIGFLAVIFLTVLWLGFQVYPSERTEKIAVLSLQENWDDAVSWDEGPQVQKAYPNPSSNPMSELLMGDSRTYYKMPNVRIYFRFRHSLPRNAEILSAKLLFRCSFGGSTKPEVIIHYIDEDEFSFQREPWKLRLSYEKIEWSSEENNWLWKTHGHYKTPDLKYLVQEYLDWHRSSEMIGLVIINQDRNKDKFKGICSFDDEPTRSARLVIRYR